ncbi:MAG TPA: proteasome subunit alpha [Actinomycetota bacterium]|nr:proteasome subunit alpha [Actinomycetota bacterium]
MALPFYVSPEQFMKDKADYARKGIARGKSVVALTYADGILFVAENTSATLHKVSEIYDRIAFAGVGKFSEFETLRRMGIRQVDVWGYTYSREDVTARTLANSFSQALGQLFTDSPKPFEVEVLVAQVGDTSDANELYHILYDGSMGDEENFVAMGGRAEELNTFLDENYAELALHDALKLGVKTLAEVDHVAPHTGNGADQGPHVLDAANLEVAVLDRTRDRRKFRRLSDEEVTQILK